jgi:hypothetical protein
MTSFILLRPRVVMDGVDIAAPRDGLDYDFSDPSVIAYFPLNEAGSSPALDVKNSNNFAGTVGFPMTPTTPPYNGTEGRGFANASVAQATAAFRINGDLTVFLDTMGTGAVNVSCHDAALTTDPLWGVGVGASTTLWSVFDKASTITVARSFASPYRPLSYGYRAHKLCFVRRSNVWELWVGGVLQATLTGFTNARMVLGSESLTLISSSNSALAKVMIANKAFSADEIIYQQKRREGR